MDPRNLRTFLEVDRHRHAEDRLRFEERGDGLCT